MSVKTPLAWTKETLIAWAHYTMNFWRGCTMVSKECQGCYVDEDMGNKKLNFNVVRRTSGWDKAYRLNAAAARQETCALVFTCSYSDFFHKDADIWRPKVWQIIRECKNLTWLILTTTGLINSFARVSGSLRLGPEAPYRLLASRIYSDMLQRETTMVRTYGLTHINLAVRDAKQSLHFYR